MRREIGINYKNKTPPVMRDKIYARDIEEYKVGYVLWKALHEKDHNTYAMCISGKVLLNDV
ncbi:MAG: hypothetical protein J6X44_02960, partial [Thermoguttaceae bacterium]|nr:hypothetical protein [Thermoguttaceae bacterium]